MPERRLSDLSYQLGQEELLARQATTPIQEFMTKADKTFLDQYLKAPHQYGSKLSCDIADSCAVRIPPTRTMDENM